MDTIKPGYFAILKKDAYERYFSLSNGKYLTKFQRPLCFIMEDRGNKKILWAIPVTKLTEKNRDAYYRRAKEYPELHQIIRMGDKECCLLLRQMIPVTEADIDHVFNVNKKPFKMSSINYKAVRRKTRKLLIQTKEKEFLLARRSPMPIMVMYQNLDKELRKKEVVNKSEKVKIFFSRQQGKGLGR